MHISTQNKIKNYGLRRYCPICNSYVKKFEPFGVSKRPDAMCPVCHSTERHRLVWLFLKNKMNFFNEKIKMLHIAPENCFVRRFRRSQNIDYTSIDLFSSLADIKMDITDLKFSDQTFDIVYASHVLEHIPDDRKAMAEIMRVLKPNGLAIILVPIKGENTQEDLTISDPKIREKFYGQFDHVRYYGYDIVDRFTSVEFKTDVFQLTDQEVKQSKFLRLTSEPIFLCRKDGRNDFVKQATRIKDNSILPDLELEILVSESLNSFINELDEMPENFDWSDISIPARVLAKIYLEIGKSCSFIKNYQKANKYLLKSLNINRTNRVYCELFANFIRQNPKDIDIKMQTHLKEAIKIISNKKNGSLKEKYNLASYYKKIGDPKTAQKLFVELIHQMNKVQKVSHFLGKSYFHLGEIYTNQNKNKLAIDQFVKCLEYFPAHKKAKEYLWALD